MSSDDKTPCDCYEPDCDECNQHLEEQAEDKEESDFFADIIEKEDNSERAEGDDDDYDEEDMHGSHPIDNPDEDEKDSG
ncbi:MAG: hypothetical protein WAT29_10510 [Thiolinea sp.]